MTIIADSLVILGRLQEEILRYAYVSSATAGCVAIGVVVVATTVLAARSLRRRRPLPAPVAA